MQYKVMIATFPFGGAEHPTVRNWLIGVFRAIEQDKRVSSLRSMDVDDTPITMSRNRVLKECLALEMDYCLMVDSDMAPDRYLGKGSDVRPFWDSSFDFAIKHKGPCTVGAPYCGPPPHENVFVFRWANLESENPNPEFKLDQYTREDATVRIGFERVAALPTGVILIDLRAVKMLPPPWFDYEWEDPPFNTRKASTEDVFFTRNLDLIGVPNYVNWDAWAGHHKKKCVGRPLIITSDGVAANFREAVQRNIAAGERKIEVPLGGIVGRPSLITPDDEPKQQGRKKR